MLDDFGDFDLTELPDAICDMGDDMNDLDGLGGNGDGGGYGLGGNGRGGNSLSTNGLGGNGLGSELGQLPIGRNGAGGSLSLPRSGGLPPSQAVPHELLCPISHEIMSDPVLAADGHAYERSYIEEWLSRQRTSPLTGEPLPTTNLLPCTPLKNMAAAYLNTQARH